MTIEEKMKRYIDDHHFNKSALARSINLSPTTFHATLNGKRLLRADEYLTLCEAMGADMSRIAKYDQEITQRTLQYG